MNPRPHIDSGTHSRACSWRRACRRPTWLTSSAMTKKRSASTTPARYRNARRGSREFSRMPSTAGPSSRLLSIAVESRRCSIPKTATFRTRCDRIRPPTRARLSVLKVLVRERSEQHGGSGRHGFESPTGEYPSGHAKFQKCRRRAREKRRRAASFAILTPASWTGANEMTGSRQRPRPDGWISRARG